MKKKITISAISVIFLLGIAYYLTYLRTVDPYKLEQKEDKLYYYDKETTPFTGYASENYQNGKKKYKTEFKNGKEVYKTRWYKSGEKKEYSIFQNGIQLQTLYYKNGLTSDSKELRETDKKTMYGYYQYHGIHYSYDKDGGLWRSYTFKNGKKDGIAKSYKNGRLSVITNYKNGYRHGMETFYYEDGRKNFEVPYKNGRKHGEYVSWDENGSVVRTVTYDKGRQIKSWSRYR